jgi:GTP-binding protein EngB required for normal cell division
VSILKLGPRPNITAPAVGDLGAQAVALRAALEAGGSRFDPTDRRIAKSIVNKVDERTAITGGHTVVALAGATGSGKSSLFNVLVNGDVADVGTRRPTTSLPTAGVWGAEAATRLLDWLGVGRRHAVEGHDAGEDADALEGLVLLDLPDFDSTNAEHRAEADRVLDLADVFVWVTDPQKYADARLHDEYIRTLASHAAVTLVVFNQADRLSPEYLAACRADLTRLVHEDGATGAEVIVTSAHTGQGIRDLRRELGEAVSRRTAAQQRLAGDLRYAAARLRDAVADTEPSLEGAADGPLVEALIRAAGVPTILAAVERDYRREAWARTGWPFTRWVRAFRPDPLTRLRLQPEKSDTAVPGITAADVRAVLGRSSLPPATPAARAAVDLATRDLVDQAADGLPQPWADAVADAAQEQRPELADALDQAVLQTPLRADKPLWWAVTGITQMVLAAAAVAGAVWLGVLSVMGWLRLPPVPTPYVGPVPLPTVLLLAGLVIGFVLGFGCRSAAQVGARRRKELVAARLEEAVTEVADTHIVAPLEAVLAEHRRTRELLAEAGATA